MGHPGGLPPSPENRDARPVSPRSWARLAANRNSRNPNPPVTEIPVNAARSEAQVPRSRKPREFGGMWKLREFPKPPGTCRRDSGVSGAGSRSEKTGIPKLLAPKVRPGSPLITTPQIRPPGTRCPQTCDPLQVASSEIAKAPEVHRYLEITEIPKIPGKPWGDKSARGAGPRARKTGMPDLLAPEVGPC